MSQMSALNKKGTRIEKYGEVWDSQKELNFYERFIRNKWPAEQVVIHPHYTLQPMTNIGRANINSIRYTPDVVILDPNGKILHVYDVKNSLGPYGIDNGNRLTFRLFAMTHGIPVEAVVVRANDFKSAAIGVTKPLRTTKTSKAPDPIIRRNPNYDWIEATNY